jgi:UrcA family protein
MRRLIELGCLLFTMLGFATSGNTAQTIGKIEAIGKVHVTYADLNLNDPADLRLLLDRVTQAAYEACGGDPKTHRSYRSQRREVIKAYEECRMEAVKNAITEFGSVPLLRVYRERLAADELRRKMAWRSHTEGSQPCAPHFP